MVPVQFFSNGTALNTEVVMIVGVEFVEELFLGNEHSLL